MRNISPERYFGDKNGFYIVCECNREIAEPHEPVLVYLRSNRLIQCPKCHRKYFWREEIICYECDEEVYE